MNIVYLKIEVKRAWKRLGQLYAGAALLFLLAGVLVLLADRMLYGESVVGRVPVGVAVSGEDVLAKKAVQMLGSLDSVKSVCDFEYMDREAGLKALKKGELYAVLETPEQFVQDIMNGKNTPVTVWLDGERGIEAKLFRELTEAGALTLRASQAGIYAGNELYRLYGLEGLIGQFEKDLNQDYMDYSLERSIYFRHQKVGATGEVSVLEFYEISAFVLFLFLAAIPVSGYLLPWKRVMVQKLRAAGVGAGCQIFARITGMGMLLLAGSFPVILILVFTEQLSWSMILAAVWPLSCVAAASVIVLLYQIGGSLLGGIMLLFFVVAGQHFLAGGILPLVFLPQSLQTIGQYFPSAILMDTMKMAVSETWDTGKLTACLGLAIGAWLSGVAAERGRR